MIGVSGMIVYQLYRNISVFNGSMLSVGKVMRLMEHKYNVINVKYLGHGQDFDSFYVAIKDDYGAGYVVRFPRCNDVIEKMKIEMDCLKMIRDEMKNIEFMIPYYKGNIESMEGYRFGMYGMIQGKPLCQCSLNERNNILEYNIPKLASFLVKLHQLSGNVNSAVVPKEKAYHEWDCLVEECIS